MTLSLSSTSAVADCHPRSHPLLGGRSIEAAVGGTPVLWIDRPFNGGGRGFWAKLEGFNPGGIKDRPALHMVRRARERGDLAPGARIVESTSGTLGLGLALAGIAYGHPVAVVTDPGMEPLMHRMLRAHGATVDLVDRPCPTGGWQEARRRRVRELLLSDPDSYCPTSTTTPTMSRPMRRSPRSCSTRSARSTSSYVRSGLAGTLPVCPARCAPLSPRYASSRSTPSDRPSSVSPSGPALCEDWVRASFPATSTTPPSTRCIGSHPRKPCGPAARSRARATPPAAGASGQWHWSQAGLLVQRLPGSRVVAVFPDGPQRYFDTVYNDEYCRRHGLLDVRPAERPSELDQCTDRAVTRWSRCENVVSPRTR